MSSSTTTSEIADGLLSTGDFCPVLQGVLDVTSEGILGLASTGTIVFATAALEPIVGYRPDELIDTSITHLIPEELNPDQDTPISRYLQPDEDCRESMALHVTGRHKSGAKRKLEISFQHLEEDAPDLVLIRVRDVTGPAPDEWDREQQAAIIDAVGDGIYQLDSAGNIVAVNDVAVRISGYSREELLGEHVSRVLSDSDIAKTLEVIQTLLTDDEQHVGVVELDVQLADETTLPCEARIAVLESDGEFAGTVGVLRDISKRKHREQEIQRQRDEVDELNRINTVMRKLNQSLVGAPTRTEVEDQVCARLAESDLYVEASIGELDATDFEVTIRAASGFANDYREAVHSLSELELADAYTTQALETGRVQVVQDITADPAFPDTLRTRARDRGVKAVIAVPLIHQDSIYGLLVVYARRANAFSEREQAVFAELGETIGTAINAALTRELLYTDIIRELEFRTTDSGISFVDVTDTADCTVSLDHVVPIAEERFLFYVTVTDVAADRFIELMANEPGVREVRLIRDTVEECRFEVEIANPTLTAIFARHGAKTRAAVADHGTIRIEAEAPPTTDLRRLVEDVQATYPKTEFTAKREVERTVQTGPEFQANLLDRLTDRQRTAIEIAYSAGYFAWPKRGSTGEEIASVMGIAAPTFHQHFRAAERRLLSGLLEDPR